MAKQGSGYLASSKIETSAAMQQVIDESPSHWTIPYSLYKFSFLNYDTCTCIINGETEMYLEAGEGFEMSVPDKPIVSFVIKESGIRYTYRGAF